MRVVYSLRQDLDTNPKRVADTQARTLDNRDLPGGLKGTYGLFGSEQWWENLNRGVIPTTTLTGIITRTYREGMHNESLGFEMRLHDGSSFKWSCVSNHRRDLKFYQVGKSLSFKYATEPLKNPVKRQDGYETTTQITLEIAIEE